MITKESLGVIFFSISLAVFLSTCIYALFGRKFVKEIASALFAVGSGAAIGATAAFASAGELSAGVISGYVLTCLAMMSFFGGLCLAFVRRKHGLWWFAGFMLLTVFILQIAINTAYPYDYGDPAEKLSNGVVAARAISGIFQIFSLDAGYAEIMAAGEIAFSGGAHMFCGMFFIMTFVAPATGGFAIFGVICHFFPYLGLVVFSFRRTRYVFSELNEYSIATAESIVDKRNYYKQKGKSGTRIKEEQKWLSSSLIVFTDAYADKDEEVSSELIERAKKIGAICVKDDISECNIRWMFGHKNKKIVYFLMDVDEESNLKTATTILAPENKQLRKVGNIELYVFSKTDDANALIGNAYRKLKEDGENARTAIGYKIINEYKNLIYQLIDSDARLSGERSDAVYDDRPHGCVDNTYPLYYALEKNGSMDLRKLSVVVIGSGMIGKEFIKAAYWCGQMLNTTRRGNSELLPFEPTDLRITVVAQNAKQTESRLRFEMPEVFDGKLEPYKYCRFEFKNSEFGAAGENIDDFNDVFAKYCVDADYVLVALGDDEKNMQAAHWVKRELDRINIKSLRQVPINYVVENGDLCDSLVVSDGILSEQGCILNPFGSLSQRYDFDNIYMSALEQRAWIVEKAHSMTSSKAEFLMRDYELNSSIAPVLHYSYKLAVFGGAPTDEAGERARIHALIKPENRVPLYWLEHRRWCAYIRSTGRRCPTANEFFAYAFKPDRSFDKSRMKKVNLELKLHPCLVESGAFLPTVSEIAGKVESEGNNIAQCVDAGKRLADCAPIGLDKWLMGNTPFLPPHYDALDRLSVLVRSDYKAYDVNTSVNLYNDELRGNIIGLIYSERPAEAKEWIDTLLDQYKEGDRDCIVRNDNKFVRVGTWEKYHIIAAKFKNDSYKKDGDTVLGMRNVEDISLRSVKNSGFIRFVADDTALVGIGVDQSWAFEGKQLKVAYDDRGNVLM